MEFDFFWGGCLLRNVTWFFIQKAAIFVNFVDIIDLFKSYAFSLYVNHIIIRTDHLTTNPVLNQ